MPAFGSVRALPFRAVRPLWWAVLVLLLLSAAYVAPAGRTYILIDDNLDTELAVPYVLVQEGKALDYSPGTEVARLLEGIPRNALRPGLQPLVGLMAVLPPLPAYLLHELLVRLAGLLGMYALLRRYWLRQPASAADCAGLALAWAVLPTYTAYGLSVLGQPWVVWALLNLRARRQIGLSFAALAGFALWSSLVLAGVFVLGAGGVAILADAVRTRRVGWYPVLGLVVMSGAYLVVEYPLVSSLLVQRQFVPHRLEFDFARLAPGGVGAGLAGAVRYFLLGQYHAGLFARVVPLLAAGLAVGLSRGAGVSQLRRQLVSILLVLGAAALFCGFYPQLVGVAQRSVPALAAFNLSRIHFLTPLAWFGVLVLSLQYLSTGRVAGVLIGLQLLVGLGMNTEWTLNVRHLLGRLPASEPTYAAFVAPNLFQEVQRDILARTGQAPADYRVACLGLPPAVASLNNFYTLDAYLNNYPLTYKHAFRPIIAGELAKSPELAAYFDAWGNRCYLFSAELGKNFRVASLPGRTVQRWAFNAAAFRQLGGRYVVSAVRLAGPQESGLRQFGHYARPGAYWQLWVYEVQQ
ncbi:DUF6044 family protein [Hymenobacter pini]|uniref:DUF6044 family protein n=1 Tax=Hymenobacter pini TaxID=2880879 RepID=UPI001CF30147|nr:DUF6044 family protein [Hymenobacter pini]MCA8829966.1 DUF6044 family protein [Hymenobacter pini]